MTSDHMDYWCESCQSKVNVDWETIVDAIRRLGHLKRSAQPSVELVTELTRSLDLRLPCDACGGRLQSDRSPNQDLDSNKTLDLSWETERRCAECGKVIPEERLEIFPESTHCVSCQNLQDKGGSSENYGYCEHCGDQLQVASTTGSRVSGYQLRCVGCGHRQ